MKEKLQEYALIAEIVGAVAIVLSLVFVGIGIRENNDLNRYLAYDRNIASIISERDLMILNVDIMSMYRNYQAGDISNLTDTDRYRLIYVIRNTFGNYEKAYYSYSLNIMEDPEWTRYETQICVQKNYLDINQLKDDIYPVLSNEFQEFIDNFCNQIN